MQLTAKNFRLYRLASPVARHLHELVKRLASVSAGQEFDAGVHLKSKESSGFT